MSFARRALNDNAAGHALDRSRSYPEASLPNRSFADESMVPDQPDHVFVDEGTVAGFASPARLSPSRRIQYFEAEIHG